MKFTILVTMSVLSIAVAGCAGRASSIAPVSIASADYSGLSCPAAREELAEARTREAALTRRQNNAALADVAGVALLFLPLGSVFGADVAGELAQAKGETVALERHIRSNCGG